MNKYVDVDPKYEVERIGGYGINYKRIHDEVIRQFELGNIDINGNPIAYIKVHGIDVNVSYIVVKSKPWESYYQALAPTVNKILTSKDLHEINFYEVINERRLI